jgi:hypothetical protein
MMVTFHRRFPGAELPKRRVELYREMCLLQLRDRPAARKLDTLLIQCDAQTILQMLALEMMRNRWERIDCANLLRELTIYLQQQGETIAATDFLEQVVQISELLVERESDEFEFAHLSFQEYLAATQIVHHQPEKVLYDYIDDDWWKPTIFLCVAQIKDPTSLIRTIHQRGVTDFAYICLQETTKRLDPTLVAELNALKQTVQTSRYAKLENYLSQGQWQDANRETYRLMITTVGKEEGQSFTPDELQNFPYEELLAIDGLWVKYSNGKSGFSVQKEIYLECGGKTDGLYREKVFEKFGDRVGWRSNGRWKSKVAFNTSAPRGHLPLVVFSRHLASRGDDFGVWSSFVGLGSLLAVVFLSRIETCEL